MQKLTIEPDWCETKAKQNEAMSQSDWVEERKCNDAQQKQKNIYSVDRAMGLRAHNIILQAYAHTIMYFMYSNLFFSISLPLSPSLATSSIEMD